MSRYITASEYVSKLRWCEVNGWTEPFYKGGRWYAFPPAAVMPLEIPLQRYCFLDWLRELRPSESRELRSKKLQDFVEHYVASKIWRQGEEKEKVYVASKITNFSQSEIRELEEYLGVKIRNLNLKTWTHCFYILIRLCIFTGFCLGIVELFSLMTIHLWWIVPLFLVGTIRFGKKYFRFVLAQIDKTMPYEQLFFFLAYPVSI